MTGQFVFDKRPDGKLMFHEDIATGEFSGSKFTIKLSFPKKSVITIALENGNQYDVNLAGVAHGVLVAAHAAGELK